MPFRALLFLLRPALGLLFAWLQAPLPLPCAAESWTCLAPLALRMAAYSLIASAQFSQVWVWRPAWSPGASLALWRRTHRPSSMRTAWLHWRSGLHRTLLRTEHRRSPWPAQHWCRESSPEPPGCHTADRPPRAWDIARATRQYALCSAGSAPETGRRRSGPKCPFPAQALTRGRPADRSNRFRRSVGKVAGCWRPTLPAIARKRPSSSGAWVTGRW